jgi:extradiol dioxygenase family protein
MSGKPAIKTKGILHFTISVRDHMRAADYYSELLGCEVERTSDHFAFMKCGEDYFVLSKMPNHPRCLTT